MNIIVAFDYQRAQRIVEREFGMRMFNWVFLPSSDLDRSGRRRLIGHYITDNDNIVIDGGMSEELRNFLIIHGWDGNERRPPAKVDPLEPM